jgi:cell division protein FtsA
MTVVSLYPQGGEGAGMGARTVAALDVGSSKICCVIAEVRRFRGQRHEQLLPARITGIGVQASRGVRGGVIVDAEAAEAAVRRAVDAAERMAGVTLEEVMVNISGGRPGCDTLSAEMQVPGGGPVKPRHVSQLVQQALSRFDRPRREVVHVTPAAFSLDGSPETRARVTGMHADRLRAAVNVISLERGPLRNLEGLLARCMLRPAGIMMSAHAAARAVLVDDEAELGAAVIDIGADTTSMALFIRGRLEHAATLPVGSGHITRDLALGLNVPLGEAERLKTLHGSVLPGLDEDTEMLDLPQLGEEGAGSLQQVPRSLLTGIIRPRVEEILELARERLVEGGMRRLGVRRVVLTGGGAQLVGLREMSERVLEATARTGVPRPFTGLPQAMESPMFAVAAGLLRNAMEPAGQTFLPAASEPAEAQQTGTGGGYLSRVRAWFGDF